ncbi:uncharacterized protein LOC107414321 isoform X1 [Ziziphus jujuba]|uniref:Uncharacterized protein LOC107414321 isoform X1 n=2 Tax=Ziziphus jujuba TaxID=326968 RepID=A0A6P3ZFA2_ZIZJJ|nr:uncharacterized protein LOC107414321 isoform X1 [Ziziphus jujuba]KAH7537868.1 hypothetical protein FEM48_Zijuj03G0138800 [Ziziphus jujuba var. spinosa]
MSSFISFLFTLLLFFSMHEYCKARHLAVGNNGFASLFHYPHKGLFPGMVKVKLEIDSIGEKTKGISDSINADNAKAVAKSTENRKDHSRISITEHNKYRNGGGGGGFSGWNNAGSEIFESFCHVGLLKATRMKDPGRRGLKEDVDFKTKNVQDDDYDPPHQTPPIHNKQN